MIKYSDSPWKRGAKYNKIFIRGITILLMLILMSSSALMLSLSPDANAASITFDEFTGDPVKVSAKGAADKVLAITDMNEATRFLASSRWASHPIPTSQVMEIDNASSLLNPLESVFTQFIVTFATWMGSGVAALTALSFSSVLIDVFTRMADRIVASFAGLPLFTGQETSGGLINLSNPSTGNTLVIISSLVTIALFTTGYRAFNMKTTKTLQTRLTEWGASMLKFIFTLVLAMFIAIQSKNNHVEVSTDDITQSIQINKDNASTQQDNTNWTAPNTSDNSGKPSVNKLDSWKSGSMGWIISLFFWVANLFMGAVNNLTVALVKTPIDYISTTIDKASKNGNEVGNACDRYVDAMHYAFGRTRAAESNTSAKTVLLAYDKIYYSLFYDGYAQIYGGDTSSANNSWCWALEVANLDVSPGEWAMLSRTAGLYKEALGNGNLLDNNSGKYTDGSHLDNVLVNGVAPSQGLLLDQNGNFPSGEDQNDFVIRLSRYMGRESSTGANQAKYYYASCEWPLTEPHGKLSEEWKGVRGMGMTGGSSDTSEQVESTDETKIDTLEGNVKANAAGQINLEDTWNNPEGGKYPYMLNNDDCTSPTLVPIGHGEGDKGEDAFGFGTNSIIAKRWEYSPLKDSIMSQVYSNVRDSVVASGGIGGAIFKGAEKVSEGIGGKENQEEKDAKNPEKKFGSNINENGDKPAYEFWKRTNGTAGGANILTSISVTIAVLMLSVFMLLFLIPAFMINIVLSLLFIMVPAIMVVSFLMYIIRGAKGKGE